MTATMSAWRLPAWGEPADWSRVPVPTPSGEELLVRVTAVGLCGSDLHLLEAGPGGRFYPVPFTLGHEIAGTVVYAGPDAPASLIGHPVVVYGPRGCGRCGRCRTGAVNYCDARSPEAPVGAGIGADGGLAEFVLVERAADLVAADGLDPAQAAPLADAGLTSFHAVRMFPELADPGATVAVLGAGGLGHLVIRIAAATTPATIVAIDPRPTARRLATRSGAHHVLDGVGDRSTAVRDLAGAAGVDVVIDCVGSPDSVATAIAGVRVAGAIAVVGSAGGVVDVRKGGPLPRGVRVVQPFWGTRADLRGVVELARSGAIEVEVERWPMHRVGDALDRLRASGVGGRAVVVP